MQNITDVEFTLLKVIWEKGECTARDIHEGTQKDKKREYTTINTILGTMVTKGFIKRRRFGPIWLYSSNVSKSKVLPQIFKKVSDTIDNSIAPFLIYLSNNREFKKDEIEILKDICDNIKDKQ
ncbi:MAG: hypothetical protein HOC71_11085 [Candidatus Latescibacteria bacterium]|jgi:BlaI family transcriptional regulator, penicillinase repressor|nr:hypothetical protein [Candidatus Latescibacterota bacterium]